MNNIAVVLVALNLAITLVPVLAQQGDPALTEVWAPEPAIVTPSKENQAPSDAIVLFDGGNLDQWVSANDGVARAPWRVGNHILTVKSGSGHIQTRRSFSDYQMHIEWRIPADVSGSGQHRGNSGVFLATTGQNYRGYELQIVDCYQNKTYANGQAGSAYKQFSPLVNACKKPGEWQSFDIIWTAPRFDDDDTLRSPARLTVLQNGVLVQNNIALTGETVYIGAPKYLRHGAAPILLQDHGDQGAAVSFRNIWIRELNQ